MFESIRPITHSTTSTTPARSSPFSGASDIRHSSRMASSSCTMRMKGSAMSCMTEPSLVLTDGATTMPLSIVKPSTLIFQQKSPPTPTEWPRTPLTSSPAPLPITNQKLSETGQPTPKSMALISSATSSTTAQATYLTSSQTKPRVVNRTCFLLRSKSPWLAT